MHMKSIRFAAMAVGVLSLFARAAIDVSAEKVGGVYEINEPIRFTIRDTDGKPFTGHYEFKAGQIKKLAEGDLNSDGGSTLTIATQLDAPGAVLLDMKFKLSDGSEKHVLKGAVVAPDRIQATGPAPDDFDTFWKSKIDELNSVPMNAQPQAAPATTQPTDPPKPVDYFKITLDNIRGTKIHGQLARPQAGEKFPALLIVQWAGVYPLDKAWVTDRAKEGWLTLNINPHDLPIDQPADFYKQQYDGPLKDYWAIHNDDRDASYFLRMYLSCYRAADYLASRPDWDGKTLVVMGTSQGGLQTLMIAGLHPKITGAIANVPAGCDFLGEDVGRKAGWPQWVTHAQGKDLNKVRETSRYYDVVNFAARIKCPTFIALGLIDQVCPAAGVIAAANQITSKKEVLIMPESDHQGGNNSQQVFYDTCYGKWLPSLRAAN